MNSINDIAKQISKLNSTEIDELAVILLNEHNISATMYRFNSIVHSHVGYIGATAFAQECDLILRSAGSARIAVVKLIKEEFGLGLKEAKDLMESAPCYLKEFMDGDEAEKLKEKFDELGADVEIKYHGQ